MGNLTELFWNTIPGLLFFIALSVTPGFKDLPILKELLGFETVTKGGITATLALFLGLVFQEFGNSLIKEPMKEKVANAVYGKIPNKKTNKKQDQNSWNNIFNLGYFKGILEFTKTSKYGKSEIDNVQIFHFLHNYLWAKNTNKMPLADFFNAKASLWANTSIAVIFYLVSVGLLLVTRPNYRLGNAEEYVILTLMSVGLFLICCNGTRQNLRRFYDVILNTFVAITNPDKLRTSK